MNMGTTQSNLTARQRIERAMVQIFRTPELMQFGPLAAFATVRTDKESGKVCATAYTDGRRIVIGEAFIQELSDAGLVFVILHEALHIMLRHLFIWRAIAKEDPQTTNAAMDYVINLMLHDLSKKTPALEFPKDKNGKVIGLLDERFRGMDTGQVYKILKSEEDTGNAGSSTTQTSPGSGSFDEHDFDGGYSDAEEAEIQREVEQVVRQGSDIAGRMGGKVSRELQQVLESKLDWREALRDYVTSAMTKGYEESTWRRFNRRLLASDIYMPTYQDMKLRRLVVAVDTSGSIGGELLGQFLGEVVGIAESVAPDEVVLLYWDAHVVGEERYGNNGVPYDTMLEATKPVGGGGTTPSCIPKYLRSKELTDADCVVVLTDGDFYDGSQGDWNEIVEPLWCVVGRRAKSFVAEVGDVLPIEK